MTTSTSTTTPITTPIATPAPITQTEVKESLKGVNAILVHDNQCGILGETGEVKHFDKETGSLKKSQIGEFLTGGDLSKTAIHQLKDQTAFNNIDKFKEKGNLSPEKIIEKCVPATETAKDQKSFFSKIGSLVGGVANWFGNKIKLILIVEFITSKKADPAPSSATLSSSPPATASPATPMTPMTPMTPITPITPITPPSSATLPVTQQKTELK